MSTIFFIRHGQASFGKENYDELSETGHRQARLLARYFDDLNLAFDLVCTGTLERHLKTSEKLTELLKKKGRPQPEMLHLDGLDEYPTKEIFIALAPVAVKADPSLSEEIQKLMTDRKSFQRVFESVMSIWTSGEYSNNGIIAWKEFAARVNSSIDQVMKGHGAGKTIAVFTSGGPISVAVQRTLNLSGHDTMRVAEQLVNTSVSRFKCTTDRIMMATFNEYPHLEREKDVNLITYR
jgi:broad specificity phosphatase PhoE